DVPGRGLAQAVRWWSRGEDAGAWITLLATVVVGGTALWRRGIRGPFGPAILVELALLLVLARDPLRYAVGSVRYVTGVLDLGLVALLCPPADRRLLRLARPAGTTGGGWWPPGGTPRPEPGTPAAAPGP